MRWITVLLVVLAGCGGSGGGSGAVSQKDVTACVKKGGLELSDAGTVDPASKATGQIYARGPDSRIYVLFFKDATAAKAYLKAKGGAVDGAGKPGGQDVRKTTMVAWLGGGTSFSNAGKTLSTVRDCI